jgi:octaprenyl-diphosphate synthase
MLTKSDTVAKPHDQLAAYLSGDLDAVGTLIAERMASEHAPRIPEVTAHLVGVGCGAYVWVRRTVPRTSGRHR